MKDMGQPVIKDVVLVGAGHAHVGVLRKFGMNPIPGVRFTLITREVHTPYSGMLPGLVAGIYGFDDAHIDTGPLSRFAGARLYQDQVTDIDFANKRVICAGRPPVPYDVLSLNTGSTPNTATVPGATEHAIPVKPIDGFLERFKALLARVLANRGRARIALVGAGAGGVELLLSVDRRLRREVEAAGLPTDGLSFCLISGDADILPTFPDGFRDRFRAVLKERDIAVVTGARVTKVEEGRLLLDGHAPVEADEILWTTQAAPARWLAKTGLPLDQNGFLQVDENLRVVGHDDIFAAGDTIAFTPRALPKSGVYAVRAGPVLGRQSAPPADRPDAEAVPAPARCAVPCHHRRALCGRAPATASCLPASGSGAGRTGSIVRFMRKFNEPPEMVDPPAEILAARRPAGAEGNLRHRHALRRLRRQGRRNGTDARARRIVPAQRDDVVVGLDAPDDAAARRYRRRAAVGPDRRLLPRHRRRPLSARKDRRQSFARRYLRHGRRAAVARSPSRPCPMAWRTRSRPTCRP